jgi:hypothetical protein
LAVTLINDILKEFLFTGSKSETRFIAGFLEKKQIEGADAPEGKQTGWLAELAEIVGLLSLYQKQPEDEGEAKTPDENQEAQTVPGIDRAAFDKVYASVKGLYLFSLDFALFDMLKETNRPNAFSDEMSKFIRVYNDKHRSKRAIMAKIVCQYRHYAEYYLANANPPGKLKADASLETDAFYEAVSREGLSPADFSLSRDEAREFFADRHEYVMMWLRPLESRIKGGIVTTKRRNR